MTAVVDPEPCAAPLDRSAAWEHVTAVLRADPGQWHTVRTCDTRSAAKTTARDIRRGGLAAFRPAGRYQASNEGRDVKARYIGS